MTHMARLRKRLKLSQKKVADKIGMSRGYYAFMEQGRLKPTPCWRKKLEKFYGELWEVLVKDIEEGEQDEN